MGTTPILGPDVITNGGFDSDTAWVKGAAWTISGGKGVCSGTAGSFISEVLKVVLGKTYEVAFTITDYTQGGVKAYPGTTGPGGTTRSNVGTYIEILQCAGNTTFGIGTVGATILNIDNVVVRELTYKKNSYSNLAPSNKLSI